MLARVATDDGDIGLLISHKQIVAFGTQGPRQQTAVFQRNGIGDVIGIDGEAWLGYVAQDRLIIAMDEIAQVRPNLAPLPLDAVALGAGSLFAEKYFSPARPAAALQFGQMTLHDCFARSLTHLGPRQQHSMER